MLLAPAGPLVQQAYAQAEPAPVAPVTEGPAIVSDVAMPANAAGQEGSSVSQTQTPQTTNGLTLLLGEGAQGEGGAATGPAVAEGQPLTADEVQAVLGRTEPISVTGTVTEEFKLPPESLPPPVAGTTITETFPPPESPVAPAGGDERAAGGAAICAAGRDPDRTLSQRDL